MKPQRLATLANDLNQLHQLLAMDLKVVEARVNSKPLTMHLKLLVNAPAQFQLFMDATLFESFLEDQITTKINNLREAGIDLQDIMDQYLAAGERLLAREQNPS